MLTPEQRAQVVEAMARITSMRYDLEEIEKRLNKFREVKADPSDPYSIEISDATDVLPNVRESMSDAIDVLDMFAKPNEKEGK